MRSILTINLFFACIATASLQGCSKLTATTTAVSIITSTPALAEAQNADLLLLETIGDELLPEATAALVGIADRDGVTSQEVSPVTTATTKVSFIASTITLCPVASTPGIYQTSSAQGAPCPSELFYQAGAEYRTVIYDHDEIFTLEVRAPEALAAEHVVFAPAFTNAAIPTLSLVRHPLETALQVNWAEAPGAADKRMILTLFRVNYLGNDLGDDPQAMLEPNSWIADAHNPIYTNLPTAPGEIFSFITEKPTAAVIPASSFERAGLYLLVATHANMDNDTSSNLSLGSNALAGKGTGFLFIGN